MAEKLVKEMTMYQGSLCDSLEAENERYDEFNAKYDLGQLITNLERSRAKLTSLKADMAGYSERSRALKKRAEKLMGAKQEEEQRFAYEMDRVKQMEQHLKPVIPEHP